MASVTLPTLVAISIGAIVGANARFLVGGWLAERLTAGFPWPTIAINLAGSFLLGLVLVLSAERGLGPWWVRPAIAVGVTRSAALPGARRSISSYVHALPSGS